MPKHEASLPGAETDRHSPGADAPVRTYRAWDEEDEAEFIAHELHRLFKCGAVKCNLVNIHPSLHDERACCIEQIKSFGEAAVLFRTNGQAHAIEESLKAINISYRVLGPASARRSPLPVREVAVYIRAILNPTDDAGLLRAVSFPISAPRRGAPSVGDRTRAKIREWANASNITVAAAMSLIDAALPANKSSARVRVLSKCEPQSEANQSLPLKLNGTVLSTKKSDSKHDTKEIVLTARQAGAISAAARVFKELRSAAEAGLSVPDLLCAILDRAGFRSRCSNGCYESCEHFTLTNRNR